jgi:hypothetical protein
MFSLSDLAIVFDAELHAVHEGLVYLPDIYFLTSGASSLEWVKPTAEGGGICFLFICVCFVLCSFVICVFFFVFVYIAIMADGR